MRILIALLLNCITTSLFAATPTHIQASYDVSARGIKIAVITETFTRTGSTYRIESITKPVGLLATFRPDTLTAVSTGDVTEKGLHPQSFTYELSQDTSKNAKAVFDWAKTTVTHNDSLGQRVAQLPADAQDRLSLLYQFGYMDINAGKELTAHVSDGRNLNTRVYQKHPKRKIIVPFGTLDTLYLSTVPQKTPWKTEIWLSLEHKNFPSKIVVTEDSGDTLTQVLTSLSITE